MASLLNSIRRSSAASSSNTSLASLNANLGPPTSEIFTRPPPGVGPKKKLVHTKEQEEKMKALKEYAYTLLLPESDPYYPWEKRFLEDPGTMSRYCRAAKWKLPEAKHRIKGTMEWRREYKPELIKESDVSIEAETGKIILTGFDIEGRPVIYMRPGRENTEQSPRQIEHLIFVLERAIDLMPPSVETLVIIVDYASATSQTNPSVGTARKVLHILQSHYVERMGRAIVVRMPWWVNAFFTAISPFLDPVTKDKMRFNPKLPELIPPQQLDAEFGGEYNFKFDHAVYWKTLVDFCHLAPDGGRLDKEGKPTVPSSGYGAYAAYEGIDKVVKEEDNLEAVPADETPAPTDAEENNTSDQVNGAAISSSPSTETDTKDVQNRMAELKVEAPTSTNVDIPVVPTAPGPPVSGPIAFDHPPNEEEKQQAKELLEKVKNA